MKKYLTFPLLSSLYGRIFAIFWLTLLLVLIGVVIGPNFDPRDRHDIAADHLSKMTQIAAYITGKYSESDDLKAALKEISHKAHNHDESLSLFFTTPTGEILDKPKELRGRKKALLNFLTLSDDPKLPQQKLYARTMMAGPFDIIIAKETVYMYVGRYWKKPPPFILRILDKPIQLLLVTMLISTPFLLWLAWALSQPARRLQKAAERVAKGQFEQDKRLEKGPKEFRKTGQSFNQMVGSLNTMISGQQRLLSDISHELRSPLTRLRMATALATRKQGESSELSRIDMEAERLEQMISELLELSRIQVNSHQEREETDAYSLWFDILEDAKFEAEHLNKNLTYSGLEEIAVFGNPNLLMSAVENVIRNAIKYGNDIITINLTENQKTITIHVDDNGEGVPDDELQDIFKPFYRVSTARDRSSGGTGLGLAITESAIRQHNGTILASKSPLGGLRMTISLPISH
ncbi:envelope stress sensor histidine kinase CpxA [Aliivibrio salmonicida]|uniref:histidine kinase n=1 Tax=Aliivibrio salmonicida (strain LFI1238) TaxID=316275 RepID=B6EN64_ALISL|nr:envelope stress sensor histidine kinase CpxA [Aliivibrio salmonicida]AZL85892.1 envelope stress sensor histidine kinase CpxA [Aliivibrio salmonicida]CAQ80482.1 sensor protein CpxA [Aliivibrio salmonicida LFI1238]